MIFKYENKRIGKIVYNILESGNFFQLKNMLLLTCQSITYNINIAEPIKR